MAATAEDDGVLAPSIAARWQRDGIVFATPPGSNDDWYWMYAALSAPVPDAVRIVSNDQMRDHHYLMLHTRDFAEWRERRQVSYTFRFDAAARRMAPVFAEPRSYSHRIQATADGRAWHLPIAGEPERWLVLRRGAGGEGEPRGEEGEVEERAQAAPS